jgi:hypothetical protein
MLAVASVPHYTQPLNFFDEGILCIFDTGGRGEVFSLYLNGDWLSFLVT